MPARNETGTGIIPQYPARKGKIFVRIPEFASKGEVVWRAGERESPEGVTVALRE